MIDIASVPPSQFGVAEQISSSKNRDALNGQAIDPLFCGLACEVSAHSESDFRERRCGALIDT